MFNVGLVKGRLMKFWQRSGSYSGYKKISEKPHLGGPPSMNVF